MAKGKAKASKPRFPPRQPYRAPAVERWKPSVEGHRLVYTHGVGPLGPVHRQALLSTGAYEDRTVCGNWAGRPTPTTPVLDVEDDPCPVCFRGTEHGLGSVQRQPGDTAKGGDLP